MPSRKRPFAAPWNVSANYNSIMNRMNKIPLGADLLLTAWVVVVAIIFFGPLFVPMIGLWTTGASLLYLLMIVASAAIIALRFVRRGRSQPHDRA